MMTQLKPKTVQHVFKALSLRSAAEKSTDAGFPHFLARSSSSTLHSFFQSYFQSIFFFWQWFVFLCILFINVCLFFCTNFLFSFLFCFSLSVSLSRMRAGRWAKGEGLGLGQSGRLFLFFLFQKRSISERKTPKKNGVWRRFVSPNETFHLVTVIIAMIIITTLISFLLLDWFLLANREGTVRKERETEKPGGKRERERERDTHTDTERLNW